MMNNQQLTCLIIHDNNCLWALSLLELKSALDILNFHRMWNSSALNCNGFETYFSIVRTIFHWNLSIVNHLKRLQHAKLCPQSQQLANLSKMHAHTCADAHNSKLLRHKFMLSTAHESNEYFPASCCNTQNRLYTHFMFN